MLSKLSASISSVSYSRENLVDLQIFMTHPYKLAKECQLKGASGTFWLCFI